MEYEMKTNSKQLSLTNTFNTFWDLDERKRNHRKDIKILTFKGAYQLGGNEKDNEHSHKTNNNSIL